MAVVRSSRPERRAVLRDDRARAVDARALAADHELDGVVRLLARILEELDAAIEAQIETALPLRRIRARIVDRDLEADRLGVLTREPLDRMQLVRVRHAAPIHPE